MRLCLILPSKNLRLATALKLLVLKKLRNEEVPLPCLRYVRYCPLPCLRYVHLLYITGQTLTGAGGGGFVVLLTKEPNMADKVKAVIQENRVFDFYIDFFLISFYLSNLHRPLKN